MAPLYKTSRPAPGGGGGSTTTTTTTITSSFLLSNLHCPSCVSTIRSALHDSCGDDVRWVSPNIVTSVVTVEHSPAADTTAMAKTLSEAGFDVCSVTSSDGNVLEAPIGGPPRSSHSPSSPSAASSPSPAAAAATQGESSSSSGGGRHDITRAPSALSRWVGGPWLARRTIAEQLSQEQTHLDNCEQCRQAKNTKKESNTARAHGTAATSSDETTSPSSPPSQIPDDSVSSKKPSVSVPPSADLMLDKPLIIVETEEAVTAQPTWRANLAVGGMTCAVCVNAITDELNKADWISKVAVNLVSNSAMVEFNDREKADKVVEMIEDLGYEATIDSVGAVEEERPKRLERTVEIMVDGLYCEHCPARVTNSLAGFFGRSLTVDSPPLTKERPIIKITYVPEAPQFTVRHILAAIEASDPAFDASIYHPPTLEERSKLIQAKHQRQILYRVVLTGIICIPTFIIGIVYMSLLPHSNPDMMFIMDPWTSGISRAQMALFILATPVYFFGADIFHVRAFKEIRTLWRRGSRTPILQRFYRFGSMNTLMSLGTTIAYVSSVSQMIAAAAYQLEEVSDSNFYFDSVVFLTFFLLVGRLIESYSKSKTGDAVESLGKLRPTTAILVERGDPEKGDSEDKTIKADLLDFGDTVRVPHGASPPADGVITQGETNFDESSLTGESRLIKKTVGDEVFSGTVNKDAPVLVRITGVAGASMLDQIVAVVREGQTKRAPMEQIADLLTTYFVPIVTLTAIATWIIWLSLGLFGRIPSHFLDVTSGGWVAFSLQFAIAVFVVACPCGLGLAAPTAIFVAGGMAAKLGILAKGGGEAFELASRVDTIVFDKTGTLTVGGEPSITDSVFYPQEDVEEKDEKEKEASIKKKPDLIAALKAVEENSSHPIAKAIVSFCTEQQQQQQQQQQPQTAAAAGGNIENPQEVPGKGMKATYAATNPDDSFELLVGNEALMADFDVAISPATAATLQKWKSEAKSVALAAIRAALSTTTTTPSSSPFTLAAALSISDPIRPEAAAIVSALGARGIRVYMLSGDNATTAAAVAAQLGIAADNVIAEVLPTEKAAQIQRLQSTLHRPGSTTRRATVAMVGDGINDAPALTQADVGVAIGSGSDVAISSADFVLVRAQLQAVLALLDLARVVFRRITFNFGWALIYNVVAVPVAAGALYPVKTASGQHVRLDPVWASLAMALSSISVVMSSLALRSRLPWIGFREKKVEIK